MPHKPERTWTAAETDSRLPYRHGESLGDRLLRLALLPNESELRSGADRLRPPYAAPVRGLTPVTASASRDLEVGYGRLPGAYQRALQAAPVRETQVGTHAPGYTRMGVTVGPFEGEPAKLAGDTAKTMTHELVHEQQGRWRSLPAMDRGPMLSPEVEEALARIVAGDVKGELGGRADTERAREQAGMEDVKIRARYPDPTPPSSGWSGWLDALGRMLGR
jgi:hypothetical protein